MKTANWIAAATLVFALAASTLGAQDTVWMKNGDRVTGTVKYIEDTDLVVDVYGTDVKIALGDIKSFSSKTPMHVELADGAIVKGPIEARDGGGIAVVRPEGAVSVADLSTLSDLYDPQDPPDSKKTWLGKIIIAAAASGGNTRARSARADADLRGDFDHFRISFVAGGDYGDAANPGSNNRVLNTRRAYGQAQFDWKFANRAFAYARTRFEGDEFQNLSLRSTYGAGLGYSLIDEDKQSWDISAGASWVTEDNDNGTRDRAYATADGEFDYRVEIADNVVFTQNILAFLNLKDSDDLRVISRTGLEVAVSETLSIDLALLYEYDNQPAPGLKREDWRVFVGGGFRFW